MKTRTKLYLIFALTALLVILALPREDRVFNALGLKNVALKVRQGLDLKGGANLTYQADLSAIKPNDRQTAIDGTINVINKRVNPAGTSEVVVQTSGSDRIVVSLPGVTDVNQAAETIGKTAQLTFFEVGPSGTPTPTDITGKDLSLATPDIDAQTGKAIITFEMKPESVKKFADLTTKINQENGRLAILLDDQVLFNGGVNSPITDGKGQMEGFKDVADARQISVLLNAGALPVPINLVAQRTVGATLGSEAISRSLVAGIIGLLAVMIFMVLYYRLAGLVAASALIIYTLINIALFKLSGFTPWVIVLTLAGIAGFILSIGMAVDANILIFERMKEEVRSGKDLRSALNAGFSRAWSSIRDSNVSTLITCILLYSFGAPIIKGFAVTLALGVLVSMFTAITVSRTFMSYLITTKLGQSHRAYGFEEAGGTDK
ncbi:protein translocase subunit SecD [bacterium]|nr:protein translocase subunit SecD [bacterium]